MSPLYTILKRFPYILSLIAGSIFYLCAHLTGGNLSGFLLNISASLFTIPIVIYSYELIKEKISKESNRDVSEYVKMNIDSELLSLLDRVSPLVSKKVAPGLEKVLVFLRMDEADIRKNLTRTTPFVFHLATEWARSERQFSKLLANELIYNNMTIDERNMLIRLIKITRTLNYATDPRFYVAESKPNSDYRVINGNEIDRVTKFNNRYLLLKKSKRDGEFRVAAFNDIDINKYKIDLLMQMKIDKEGQKLLFSALIEIKSCVDIWLNTRGDSFILDDKIYKLSLGRISTKKT